MKIILVHLFLILSVSLFSQQNPFIGSGSQDSEGQDQARAPRELQITEEENGWTRFVTPVVRNIQKTFEETAIEISKGQNFWAAFIFIAISFLYGAMHVLGPGHGKVLISSYIASTPVEKKDLLKLGFFISSLHAGITGVIILVAFFLLRTMVSMAIDELTGYLSIGSYLLISLLGLFLILQGIFHKHNHGCGPHCNHEHGHHDEEKPEAILAGKKESLSFWGVGFAVGMVPCTGTAGLLILTLSLDLLWVGQLGMLFLSIGMGITLTAIAFGVYQAKHAIISKKYQWLTRFDGHRFSHLLSGGLIFLIGMVFLIGSLV